MTVGLEVFQGYSLDVNGHGWHCTIVDEAKGEILKSPKYLPPGTYAIQGSVEIIPRKDGELITSDMIYEIDGGGSNVGGDVHSTWIGAGPHRQTQSLSVSTDPVLHNGMIGFETEFGKFMAK